MTSPNLSRRRLLASAGVTLSLPFLPSLLPRQARAATPPPRLLFFFVPNGVIMNSWAPQQTGSGYTLSPTLLPLADVKDDVLVISGLDNEPASRDRNGDHTNGTAAFLTCTQPLKSGVKLATSVDQVAAAIIGKTAFPSLQLGVGAPSSSHCDGYPCPYGNNISWANATTPLAKTANPQALFDLLFKGIDPAATMREQQKRKLYRQSVIDAVQDDLASVQARLAKTDAAKLDEYLTGIRQVENRLETAMDPVAASCTAAQRPPAPTMAFPQALELMMDLSVLAMRCDRTRVISLMLHAAQSDPSYAFMGVSGGHHSISHHGGNQENIRKLLLIEKWEVTQFASLVQKMKNVEEGDGTLLSNSLVFLSSDVSDSDRHTHVNMPVLLAGSAGGKVKGGRHMRVPPGTQMADLFLTMLKHSGVPATSFANSRGVLQLG